MSKKKQRITDLFITAYEGGSSYWAYMNIKFTDEDRQLFNEGTSPSELLVKRMYEGEAYEVFDVETDDLLGLVSKESLNKAYKLMREEYPSHYADLINDNWDAWTADVFLQLAVMDEIVFG